MADTTMPPIELAERSMLLLGLAFFLGLALKAIYKRDGPAIPGGMGTFTLGTGIEGLRWLRIHRPRP